MEIKYYTREQLYQEVWSTPITKLELKFGLSDTTIEKKCKKYEIPMPPRGYWTKVKAGIKFVLPELPQYTSDEKIELKVYDENERLQPKQKEKKLGSRLSYLPETQREEIWNYCKKLKVPTTLENPHELIRNTMKYYQKGARKPPINKVIYSFISDISRDRVNKLYDTLFKVLTHFGFTIGIEQKDIYGDWYFNKSITGDELYKNVIVITNKSDFVYIYVMGAKSKVPHIPTKEDQKQIKINAHALRKFDIIFSDTLTFNIVPKELCAFGHEFWRDNPYSTIEDKIGDMVIGIMDTLHYKQLTREKYDQELELKKQQEKRIDQEKLKLNELVIKSQQFAESSKIYAYVNAMKEKLDQIDDENEKEQLTEYIEWAKLKADWINPLFFDKTDELLGKFDDSWFSTFRIRNPHIENKYDF